MEHQQAGALCIHWGHLNSRVHILLSVCGCTEQAHSLLLPKRLGQYPMCMPWRKAPQLGQHPLAHQAMCGGFRAEIARHFPAAAFSSSQATYLTFIITGTGRLPLAERHMRYVAAPPF